MKQVNKPNLSVPVVFRFGDLIRNSFSTMVISMFCVVCSGVVFGQQSDVDFAWVKAMGEPGVNAVGNETILDASGNVYVTGYFTGPVDFDPGSGTTLLTSGGVGPDVYAAKYTSEGVLVWAKGFTAVNNASGNDIAVDTSGNVYITGNFRDGINFGSGTAPLTSAGDQDVFIAKLDRDGNCIWSRGVGGSDADWGSGIDVDISGNVYATGNYKLFADFGSFTLASVSMEDVFVAKLNAGGTFLWATSMGGVKADGGSDIVVDHIGNSYITGNFGETATFGTITLSNGGFWTLFVAKLNANGVPVWAKGAGGTFPGEFMEGRVLGSGIALDEAGNVYTTGLFQQKVDFNPGTSAADTFSLTSEGTSNPFILKLDNSGSFIWAKGFIGLPGASFFAAPNGGGVGITTDIAGNVYTTGNFGGGFDFDPGKGNFPIVSDSFELMPDFVMNRTNAYISKLDTDGDFVWAKSLGGRGDAYDAGGRGIAVNKSGGVYTTGVFSGKVDFDPGNNTFIVNANVNSIYIHKLSCAADTAATISVEANCLGYTINNETFKDAGIHYTTFTGRSGCDSVVAIHLSLLLPQPVINVNVDTLSTTKSYTTYQWLKNGVVIPGATQAQHTVTGNDDYQVIVTDENGCSATSEIYTVTNKTDIKGISDLKSQISVYPNPAKDYLYINIPISIDVVLTEIDGRSIMQLKNVTSFSIQNLVSGVYLLRITDKDGKLVKVEKLIKQ